MQEIAIHYYLAEDLIACRYTGPPPRIGESVMVEDAQYQVADVMWIEGDDQTPHADIELRLSSPPSISGTVIDPAKVSDTTFVYMGPNIYLDVILIGGNVVRIRHEPPLTDIYQLNRVLLGDR